MSHIYRRVSCAVMIALMGFLYTPSTANAELQQGNPETSHPTIYKQKHLQEIGQVAQRLSRSSKVRMLKYLDRSCKQGNSNSCMRFGRFSERYPGAVKKMGLVKRVAQVRRQVASKVRLLTRLNASCQNGNRSSCNRYANYSKRFPVAASKIRQANNRRVASKVRLLTRLNNSCKKGSRSSCNRYANYSKRFPVAASKIRQANNRRVASKVRLLKSMDNSCRTLKNAQSRSRACNRFNSYAARYVRAMFK